MLRYVWRIGALPCALPPTDSRLPYLNSLGDTAVDFDIAPPRVVKSNNDTGMFDTTNFNVSVTSLYKNYKYFLAFLLFIFLKIAG